MITVNMMSKESDEYEKFVAGIIEDIRNTGRQVEIICHGRDCKLEGETGQEHQIDVAFVDHSLAPPVLVLVECKLRKTRNVDTATPKIAAFNEEDIGALKQHAENTMTILVTTCGYSKGAQLVSDRRELRRETVPFKADAYTFRYMDLIMGYATDTLDIVDLAELEVYRHGKLVD
jgi:hypothetical protein